MKYQKPLKRPEIRFSRTEMEVMPQHQLLELKRIGTEYERMHANAILDDRSNGNTSNHGYPAITELMASTKGQRSVTGIPVKQNRYLQGYHQNKKVKHAYRVSQIDMENDA
jgi:hypothetical protein